MKGYAMRTKQPSKRRYFLHIIAGATIACILLIALWIRIQTPAGSYTEFSSNDAYLYYWQAELISEHGKLPERDMHRWLPVGRDLGQTLNLYSYILAYTHKAIAWVFPNISLYHVSFYMPVICFCMGLGVICFFLYRTFGFFFSSFVGILLATLPGTITRSIAGFSDRDSWCLLLGILSVITYLTALQVQAPRKRILWTLISGFFVFLGGLSWEGFGVFLSIILFVEIWRFLSSETEEGLGFYLLWVSTFVPALYLSSSAYRSGHGFSTHLFALMLMPPIVVLCIRTFRYFIITKGFPLADKLHSRARTISLGLMILCLAMILGYIGIQMDTFINTTVPFSENPLMQSVQELMDFKYNSWVALYGSISFLGCIGLMVSCMHRWKTLGSVFVFPVCLFIVTTFLSEELSAILGADMSRMLFLASIFFTISIVLLIAWRINETNKYEEVYIAGIAWLFFWVALTRDAARYSFFLGPAIAFFTAELIQIGLMTLIKKLKPVNLLRKNNAQFLLKFGVVLVVLTALMFWQPLGGYATRMVTSIKIVKKASSGDLARKKAFRWMKAQLPSNTVVAANWSYGSKLNVLGGVKTIIDQDHYIQHWIHLYNRYIFCGQSEIEALQFLKTHKATHLMISEEGLVAAAPNHSAIGSTSTQNLRFEITPLLIIKHPQKQTLLVPIEENDFFKDIQWNPHTNKKAKAVLYDGQTVEIPYVVYLDKKRVHSESQTDSKFGGIVMYFDEHQKYQKGYYVPPIAWNMLSVQLFLRDIPNKTFAPVYPIENFSTAPIKIWEIRYPTNIQPNSKYLKTEIPEMDEELKLE
ncbi:hypothetical protein F4X90_05730 [Candidatus Poribacteria bacterium]|nr:hypothetical protein [Candidatus Poribacteria bacterium]